MSGTASFELDNSLTKLIVSKLWAKFDPEEEIDSADGNTNGIEKSVYLFSIPFFAGYFHSRHAS